jgi:hypothetical protein
MNPAQVSTYPIIYSSGLPNSVLSASWMRIFDLAILYTKRRRSGTFERRKSQNAIRAAPKEQGHTHSESFNMPPRRRSSIQALILTLPLIVI